MSKIVVGEIEGPSTTSNKITIASGSQLDLAGSTGTVTIDASDITTGALSSTLTYPGRLGDLEDLGGTGGFPPTALVWRDTGTSDDSAAGDVSTSAPYSWWRKLDNESDPFGIISLSGDIITITHAGEYAITFSTGCHFRALYTSAQIYNNSTSTVLPSINSFQLKVRLVTDLPNGQWEAIILYIEPFCGSLIKNIKYL